MTYTILDAGNSQVKLFGWQPEISPSGSSKAVPPLLLELGRWSTPTAQAGFASLAAQIQAVILEHSQDPLIVTTVIPGLRSELEKMELELILIDHTCAMNFEVAVDEPEKVGADRYCNVAAVFARGISNALIVDVGTATTFDLLVDGVFCGGLIAPGPRFAQECLGQQAAQLDPVEFGPAPLEAGRNTAEAMARGGWNVGMGGILYTIDGLLSRYGGLKVFLTGGLGIHLAREGWTQDPHLTLKGAVILAGISPGNS